MNPFVTSVVLLCTLPFASAAAIYLYQKFEVFLPKNQYHVLGLFAKQAVEYVEQVYGGQANAQMKKACAARAITDLFSEFGLPMPSDDVINIAIESAVLLIHQLPKEQSSRPIDVGETVYSLPVVNPKSS